MPPKKKAPAKVSKKIGTASVLDPDPPKDPPQKIKVEEESQGEIIDTVQERLRNELEQQKKTLAIKQEELLQLKEEVTAHLPDPSTKRKAIASKMLTTEEDLTLRIESMQALEQSIELMTQDIEEIKQKKVEAEGRLSEKRDIFNIELKIFIELEILIEEIDAEIQQIFDNYQLMITEKEEQRLKIINDPNLTAEEKQALLKQLDAELAGLKEECANVMSDLALKQDEWMKNSKAYAEQLENSLQELKQRYAEQLEELEKMKIGASPSEILRIDAKIAALTETYEENVKLIEKALARKEYFHDQLGRYFINDEGIKIYQRYSNASQYIVGPDGKLVKITQSIPEETALAQKSASEETVATLELKRKEDQEYIKRELGTPLRLALARITTLQPTDPINYLANFLLEYRYNQVMNIKKECELEMLLNERANLKEEIRKNKLKKQRQAEAADPKKRERQVWPHCTTCDQIVLPNDDDDKQT